MTGLLVATARWRALDREGEDTCRLSRADHGWLLVGHARFRDALGVAALNYLVRCHPDWTTHSADIAGDHDGRQVQVRITRQQSRWWVNDREQTGLTGASDLDLSFTPATNLMPLRRLGAGTDTHVSTQAAWLRYPMATLSGLDQTYWRTDQADVMHYSARQSEFETRLNVDRSGFVSHYPGFWEGEVTHAD